MSRKSLWIGLLLIVVIGFSGPARSAETGAMIPADQMQWQEMGPGSPLKMVILWGDRSKGEYAMLLKMPAGFVAPVHGRGSPPPTWSTAAGVGPRCLDGVIQTSAPSAHDQR